MKAIVDDYGEIGRRLAAMELERRYPLMVVDQMPAIDLRPGALNFVGKMPRGRFVDPDFVRSEVLARYETFKRMREVEERPITQYMSLEAIREAVRLLMPSTAENG